MLLATGDHGQEAVARRAGFGSADTMRRTFRRALGVSPSSYRSRFGPRDPPLTIHVPSPGPRLHFAGNVLDMAGTGRTRSV